jgi:hypothetical protein
VPKRSQRSGGGSEPELGRALARWLRQSMQRPDGRQRMTKQQVIKAAKIGRDSFYRVWDGRGGEVLAETLQKLATALDVPTPRIERTMRLDESNAAFAVPPLAKLQEAQALLREAIAALDAEAEAEAATLSPAAAADAARAHRLLEQSHGRVRPSGPARRGRTA